MYSTLTAKKGRVDGRGCVDGGERCVKSECEG